MIRIPLKVKANLLTQEELVTIASGSSNSIKVKFDIDPNSDFADSTLQKRAIFRYYQGSYFISDVDANGEVYVPKFVIAYPYFKVALRAESENATAVVTTNEIQVPVEKSPVFYETTITDGDVTIRNLDGALNIYKAGDVTFIDFTASYKTAVDAVIAGTYATTSALNLVTSDVDSIKKDIINMSNSISDLQGDIEDLEAGKQNVLVSGENIKTINGTSLLGSGNYDFDSTLDEASTNAVQNKVIAKFANDVAGTYVTKLELYEALKRGEVSSEVEKVYTNEINYIAENVMPSGKVTKVLGKTEKSENLLVLDDVAETTINGVTYKIIDNVIYVKGTVNIENNVEILLLSNINLSGSFNLFSSLSSASLYYRTGTSSYYSSATQQIRTNLTMDRFSLILGGTSGTDPFNQSNWISIRPMIVQGTTAPTTWSQGYNGLKHTHITGLKSTGINLWDEEWEVGGLFSGVINSKNYIPVFPSTTYYLKSPYQVGLYFYDADKNLASSGVAGANATFTTTNNCHYIKFYCSFDYGTTYKNDICINISDTTINGNYYPYEEETINIEADLNGVGTASDEINVEEGKHYQRFGVVDLGTLNWSYDSTYERWFSDSINSLIKGSLNNNTAGNLIAELYDNVATNYLLGTAGNLIAVSDNGRVNVKNGSNTTKPSGKLVYELATHIITDVEIENDGWLSNLIKDGSITQLVDTTDTTSIIAKEVDIAMNVVVDNQ